ncbi:hypothetical protein EZV62_005327 [Acer yangbiense]|uniref:DNA-(apurinic or apyrimidinic site) endonuclease n=1 Tax=Acer yangbiense TaxID=1000413 RepID=A0A5C7IPK1_9ROSI|nr:hypothetical protein EZV62_005327 [Acer yangbiense]
MHKVLQLGFSGFINFSCFALTPRILKIKTPASLKARAKGPKLFLSNSSKPISSIVEVKEDKKFKGIMDTSPNSDQGVVKENNMESEIKLQSIKDDPGRIEVMTVLELRTTLRSIGVPAKGCKRDLVYALKGYVTKKAEGNYYIIKTYIYFYYLSIGFIAKLLNSRCWEFFVCADEVSHLETQEVTSISSKNLTVKGKGKKLSIQDHVEEVSFTSEVSVPRKSKRKAKQSAVEDKTVEVDAEIVRTKRKLSIKTDEISVTLPTNQSEPWTILAHKKPQKGWVPYNPRTMRPPPPSGDTKSMKLLSWNVNGLRALLKLEGFSALQLAQREDFDVLCLQETKLQASMLEKDVESIRESLIDGYESSFWTCSVSKLGYSGTAIISRVKPLSVTYGLGIADPDSEGRVVTAEFDSFYLINCYVPNSGDGLRRLPYRIAEWDISLSSYMKELEKKKPVILTGDLNCAHQEIDIYNPAGNRRSAGFTDEERQSFGTNFLSQGFVDTFRAQHPDVVGYTYWAYRQGARKTNRGWRLDYFLVSGSIADKAHDSYILPDVGGSDHCPIGLVLKL